MERLEPRAVLVSDFGDAPDTSSGTGTGNYQTLLDNGGPSHIIDSTQTKLFLGARVDGEANAVPNAAANGDGIGSTPNDEDGVVEPARDLFLTTGTASTVRLRATNTTGTAATLYGWIDFNRDGVFDNATERTSIPVPSGTNLGTLTLTFPVMPTTASAGPSYARFRLSTDTAAANPTGVAANGEVEDYAATILLPSSGSVTNNKRLGYGGTSLGPLETGDLFGTSIANIGDLDNDGITDLAVGAGNDEVSGGPANTGTVSILFMRSDGSVRSQTKITNKSLLGGNINSSNADGQFGSAVAALGDLDGDGVGDIAVGAQDDRATEFNAGAVYVLMMNRNGSVKTQVRIGDGAGGLPRNLLPGSAHFGSSVGALGDLDGDGVVDLAVGARGDDASGFHVGAVYVLFLNRDGSAKGYTRIAKGFSGFEPAVMDTFDDLGNAVASAGDLDGDGTTDMVVAAQGQDAVYVLFLNSDGTVKRHAEISAALPGPVPSPTAGFGQSLANLGDLDGDGIDEIAVGNRWGQFGGSVFILYLRSDGSVRTHTRIGQNINGFASDTLQKDDRFDASVAALGDLNGDGIGDLAIGAPSNEPADRSAGGIYIVNLAAPTLDVDIKGNGLLIANGDLTPSPTDFTDFGPANISGGTQRRTFTISVTGNIQLQLGGVPAISISGEHSQDFSVTSSPAATLPSPLAEPDPTTHFQITFKPTAIGLRKAVVSIATNDSDEELYTFAVQGTGTQLRDFGDAPDISPGNGTGDYDTLSDRGGPSHTYVNSLYLGNYLDGDVTARPNRAATGDDAVTQRDDEDGILDPQTDLRLTAGTQPRVRLRVTNQTTSAAMLSGWIDYNHNGVFDNSTERSLATIPAGLENGLVTLIFPIVPPGSTGTTYARFRLSTDSASLNATGPAQDGEVEDYLISITNVSEGIVGDQITIRDNFNGFKRTGPVLFQTPSGGANGALLGSAVANVGDLDGDGITDMAAGARGEDAVYILFMNREGTVRDQVRIADGSAGFRLNRGPFGTAYGFGQSLAGIGDLDGDGIGDLAAATLFESVTDAHDGGIYILFLNSNGTVKRQSRIGNGSAGLPPALLKAHARFGLSLASVSDLDGDGTTDLAVGATGDGDDINKLGATYLLMLNSNGTVKSHRRIANESGSVSPNGWDLRDEFGSAIANLGDIDHDGISDLAIGANQDENLEYNDGAVHIVFMNADNSVKRRVKIAPGLSGFSENLKSFSDFGIAVASLGDLDGDGVGDFAAIARPEHNAGASAYIIYLKSDGTVRDTRRIAKDLVGARSIVNLGDLNGDGSLELAIGIEGAGGNYTTPPPGAIRIVSLLPDTTPPLLTITSTGNLTTLDQVAFSFRFSEKVVGFNSEDVVVANGIKGAFTEVGGGVFTLMVTPVAQGTVTVRVDPNAAQNVVGLGNALATESVVVDLTRPTLSISPDGEATNRSLVDFTFQFSETVLGFAATDIAVTSGVVVNFRRVDGDTFVAGISPTNDGKVTVAVAASKAIDVTGNPNFASSASFISDRTSPTATFSSVSPNPRGSRVGVVTVQFSEPVTGVNTSDFTLSRDNQSVSLSGITVNGSGTTYTLDLSSVTNVNGGYVLSLVPRGSGIQDAFGNPFSPIARLGWTKGVPYVTLATSNPVINESQSATVTAKLTDVWEQAVTVNLRISRRRENGAWNSPATAQIIIPAGSTSGSVAIQSLADDRDDAAARIRVEIDSVVNGLEFRSGEVIITVEDDDPSPISVVRNNGLLTIANTAGIATDIRIGVDVAASRVQIESRTDGAIASLFRTPIAGLRGIVVNLGPDNDRLNASNIFLPLTVSGGTGNDVIVGGAGADLLQGDAGADSIWGGDGRDTISGSLGDDFLDGGGSQDLLVEVGDVNLTITQISLTGLGTDKLAGFEAANLTGGSSDNTIDASAFEFPVGINGGAGADTLTGSSSTDTLNAGAGNDALYGLGGRDLLMGGVGDDVLDGAGGNDTLDGGTGIDIARRKNDVNFAVTNTDVIELAGDTFLSSDTLINVDSIAIEGGLSANRIDLSAWSGSGINTVRGGGGNDLIIGSSGRDDIVTLDGDDVIEARGGDDTVISGKGADSLIAGDGNDKLDSGFGPDTVSGDGGHDFVIGGEGDDSLMGGVGADTIDGVSGADLIWGGDGNDSLSGGDGAQTLLGESGNDQLRGFSGDDVLDGGSGVDSLAGDAGADTLSGGPGNDVLSGDTGADLIDGGSGVNRLDETVNGNVVIIGRSVVSEVLGGEALRNVDEVILRGGAGSNLFDARASTLAVQFLGGAGNDTLFGGQLADRISGEEGDDVVSGAGGDDLLSGGVGFDYWMEEGNADFTVSGTTVTSSTTGSETVADVERIVLIGGNSANTLNATASTVPVVLIGGLGNDTLIGGSRADTLSGGNRDDSTVAGSDGVDSLDGRNGADVLENDAADASPLGEGDTLVSDVFAGLRAWIDAL